jgi:hypothetical protein
LLAALFQLAGVSVAVERSLGFFLHVVIAALAGRVAGRALGQRFSVIVAALVATWLAVLGVNAYAWFAGLALALLVCELWAWAQARARAPAHIVTGVVLGILSWFRHDLFIYFTLVMGGCAVLWAGITLRRDRGLLLREGSPLRGALWMAGAAALVAAVFWVPVFAVAGFSQVSADLYFDQVRHTMPARVLPLPSLTALGTSGWAPVPLPAFVRAPFPAAVLLTLAGPVLAALAMALPRAAGVKDRTSLLPLAALSLAVVPQMMGRTDIWHAVFALTPGLIWASVWLLGGPARRWRPGTASALALLGVVLLCLPIRAAKAEARSKPAKAQVHLRRAGRTPVRADRQRVLSFIAKHTGRGDPIYVGLTDHRWALTNDMDLYFLSDRVGATRYMQFDPNLQNREAVQRQMIEELERSQPKVAILARGKQSKERNESRIAGSRLLDRYLRSRYQEAGKAGAFVMMRRRADAPAQPLEAVPLEAVPLEGP